MPLRTFLKSGDAKKPLSDKPLRLRRLPAVLAGELTAVRELAQQQGGWFVDEIHFTYPGDLVRSMLPTSHLGTGRTAPGTWAVLGSRRPTQPGQLEKVKFAAGLAGPAVRHAVRNAEPLTVLRPFEVSMESPATVEEVHGASVDRDYWLDRLAHFGGAKSLDSC